MYFYYFIDSSIQYFQTVPQDKLFLKDLFSSILFREDLSYYEMSFKNCEFQV